jgi:hypothetical protein
MRPIKGVKLVTLAEKENDPSVKKIARGSVQRVCRGEGADDERREEWTNRGETRGGG